MNRKSFIRNLLVLAAAPSIFAEIKPISQEKKYLICHFRIAKEMLKDNKCMNTFVKNIVKPKMKQVGMNLSKQYDTIIGYEGEDFINNRLTMIIKQET